MEKPGPLGMRMPPELSLIMARVAEYGRMIRFSHSLFLLPFAASAFLLAPKEGLSWIKAFLILLALVAARSSAMAFNRIADRSLDKANPRTAGRALPAGRIKPGEAWALVIISGACFLISALLLNSTTAFLGPPALAFVLAYSYTKRFTALSHLWLGIATSLAPAGTWVAITGTLDPEILVLVGSVALWVAGFDVLYACQDVEFDTRFGLFSIPARLGIRRALWVARMLHLGSFVGFATVGRLFSLDYPYMVGIAIIGGLFVLEHSLISEKDLSRINEAFFTVNGFISVLYLASVAAGILIH